VKEPEEIPNIFEEKSKKPRPLKKDGTSRFLLPLTTMKAARSEDLKDVD